MKLKMIALSVLFIIFYFSLASADVPKMINYQGKITTPQGALIDTIVDMTFNIYGSESGDDSLWWETQSSVAVEKGIFSVLLGSINPIPDGIFNGSVRYLGVKVGGDSEMTPRKAIVSVGYAYKAEYADTSDYAQVAVSDGDWTPDTSGINIYRLSGKVSIGTPAPSEKLDVDGSIRIRTGNALKLFNTDDTDYGAIHGVGSGGVAGIGFNTNTVSNALYLKNDGKLGIGTTTPDEKLTVDGNAHITGDLNVDGNINPSPGGCWRHSNTQVFSGTGPTDWTDLDLSSHVGNNYALVLMKIKGVSGSSTHIFRPNGDTDEYWRCNDLSDMGAQGHKGECAEAGLVVIETDANGIIEWRNNGANVTLTLLGYVK